MDVSDMLQQAIYDLKNTHNFGILFLPEGKYLISKTIYVPQAIRIIGYGRSRPLIVLKKNSPGYQQPDSLDKGKAKYMFWFISSVPKAGEPVRDAGAGTFYSALSNVDLEIEDGNPFALALRTHYAQHSFVSHADIHINHGLAGMFDVGIIKSIMDMETLQVLPALAQRDIPELPAHDTWVNLKSLGAVGANINCY